MPKTAKQRRARGHVITLRLDDEEQRRFILLARKLGLDVSAMIRHLVAEKERTI